MKLIRRGRRGVVALAATTALLASGCEFDGAYDLPLPGSPVDEDASYEVTAEFADILNVVPRSPVMVDDVTVGEVIEVDRVGWHARVTLRVREDVVLPDNAVAEIRQVSLLGEKYVSLEEPPGGGAQGRLSDGDDIPLSATGRNPEVEEVLGALSSLLSGGGVAQLGTITKELNDVMSGRTESLRDLLGSLEGVVGTLDTQKTDIIDALDSMNDLTATLNAEKATIQGALDVAGPAVEVLADQHDELIAMLTSLDRLGVVGTRVIRASKDDLIDSLRELDPVLSKLNAAGDALAPGLNLLVSFPFPKEASEIVKGDYANTAIRADISLENFVPKGADLTDLLDLPGLPDILPPLPDLPGLPGLPELPGLPGDGVAGQRGAVASCLSTKRLTSRDCAVVLDDPELLPRLVSACRTDRREDNRVCRAIGRSRPGDRGGLDLPDLPGMPGLSRLTSALSGPDTGSASGAELLYGGVL